MPKIYPIGGGKGGVGKSFIAASLGALIAKHGHKVVVIDLDLGASNLHTFLGIHSPKNGLNSFLDKSVGSLQDVAVPTDIHNLSFISSFHCAMEIANLFHAQKIKLIKAIKNLDFDYILIDLGAGTNFNTLDFFLTSCEGMFVCTPEPTSIENAFRFIKSAYLRRLKQLIKRNDFNSKVKQLAEKELHSMKSSDVINFLLTNDPDNEVFLKQRISKFNFKFILNQFRKNMDLSLGDKIETVCNRHFYSRFEFLGNIDFDERVHDAILHKRLFIREYPDAGLAVKLRKIAERLVLPPPDPSGHSPCKGDT
jgi:flagellar biosynthesis protein FlhG